MWGKAPAPLKGMPGPFFNSQEDGLECLSTWPERVICLEVEVT